MTASLRAYNVSLELPTEVHKLGSKGYSNILATISGSVRYQSAILTDINFAAADGDRIGIMGLNGAGKTSLLRVLNGAYPPTAGVVRADGTRQSLLNPLLGFSEAATVAENVFLRGTAMGIRYRQLKAIANEILDFAGLRDRAEYPLYSLSSGQRMRLGFSITTAIQPDILLMDEWLSTGDAAFVERAKKRMKDRFEGSRIVVLASHSTNLLRNTCNKALVLDKGKMRFFGELQEGLDIYKDIVANASAEIRDAIVSSDPVLFGNTKGVIEKIKLVGNRLEVTGWAMDERGNPAGVVCVEVAEQKHLVEEFERVKRQDVSAYLGKAGDYGFRVTVDLHESIEVGEIAASVRTSAGVSAGRVGAPLPVLQSCVIEAEATDR